ncbi:MAG TPA: polysaccharide deacetylase family protein [Solirubrobacteraceae bacterium]|jgi:peptidoglycan/xylan/chitin deacetylase (PgdA/CDA1 family)
MRWVPERSINLTFHGIGEPGRQLDPGERDVWVSREQFRSVLDCVVGRPDVMITFDDGNASDLRIALPALRDRRLTATFFVIAGRLGKPRFLDEAGVRALAAAGMEIGCHGMHHRRWRRLDQSALREELVEAKAILEQTAEQPVTLAACPFGSYDRNVLRALSRYGYRHVFTSDGGRARPGDFLQARNSVRPEHGSGLLEQLSGRDAGLPSGVRRRVKMAVKQWR